MQQSVRGGMECAWVVALRPHRKEPTFLLLDLGGLLVPLVLGMFQADKKVPAFQALEQHVKIKGAAQKAGRLRAGRSTGQRAYDVPAQVHSLLPWSSSKHGLKDGTCP